MSASLPVKDLSGPCPLYSLLVFHDIANAVAPTIGFLDLAITAHGQRKNPQRSPLTPPIDAHLANARKAAERVYFLAEMGRLLLGPQPPEKPIALVPWLLDFSQDSTLPIPLRVDCSHDHDPQVLVNEPFLILAIRNLLENSLRAGSKFCVAHIEHRGVEIEDFGRGLPQSIIDRIAAGGSPPSGTTLRPESSQHLTGHGLAVWIIGDVLRARGGRLEARNKYDQITGLPTGCVFTLTFGSGS